MIPYRIENVLERTPWMNWLILGATAASSILLWKNPDAPFVERWFVLGAGTPVAFLGHLFCHGSPMHLAGNLIFLWVFGNGVCAMVGNFTYGALYLLFGAIAGAAHLAIDHTPVIGASGAIFGVVAAALAFFPFTKVSVFYVLGWRPRTAQITLWVIAGYWVLYDLVNGYLGHTGVAHFAHLGGFGVGVTTGLLLLVTGRARLSHYDERSLLDVLRRRSLEQVQRERGGGRFEAAMVPTVHVATDSAPVARPAPIRLRSASAAPTPATVAGFAASTPAPSAIPSAPAAANSVDWADADCFIFDGREKHGPLTAFQALEKIRGAADTRGWLYWQTGMGAWTAVPAQASSPATAALA